MKTPKIGIIALSSVVPRAEFELGLDRLNELGFHIEVHSKIFKKDWHFAGTDQQRARSFFEFAHRGDLPVLWSARGGYGAIRLLPELERLSRERGKPPRGKLLMGYSDSTAIADYVRMNWGWSVLHAPMPGLRNFLKIKPSQLDSLYEFVCGANPKSPWKDGKLRWLGKPPRSDIEGELIGGNLMVWTSLVGTPFQPKTRNKILFFEEVDEAFYSVDRLVQTLRLSGALDGVKAMVLGEFHHCHDRVSMVLRKKPKGSDLKRIIDSEPRAAELELLRPVLSEKRAIQRIFGELSQTLNIPIAVGLPVGHGPQKAPLPLGGRYRLGKNASLTLLEWKWLGSPAALR